MYFQIIRYYKINYRRDTNNNQITSDETRSQNAIDDTKTQEVVLSWDIKQIFDKNSEQFWNDVKMKFISKEKQDGLIMLQDVYSEYFKSN